MFEIIVSFKVSRRGEGEPPPVARFTNLSEAEDYARRHDGEGGGKLDVIGVDSDSYSHCKHIVNDDVSFTYWCEAEAYRNRLARTNGCGGTP